MVANFPAWWYHMLRHTGELAMSAKKSSDTVMMNEVVNAVKARGWITYDEASEVMAKIGATQGNVRKFLRRLDTAGVEVTVKQGKNRKSDRRRTAKPTEKTNPKT